MHANIFKKIKQGEQNIKDLEDTFRLSNTCIMRLSEGGESKGHRDCLKKSWPKIFQI